MVSHSDTLFDSGKFQMAGKKGKSGGRREGSGRKKKPAATAETAPAALTPSSLPHDPEEFLLGVMRGTIAANPAQIQAANAMLRFQLKGAATGKKGERASAAKEAARGRYAPSAPPKLMAVR